MPWQEGIVESGKGLSKSHSANSKRFSKVIFPNEKHFVLSPKRKARTSKTKGRSSGESKQNFCHKEKYMRGRVLLKKNLNHSPQVKKNLFEKSK